MKRLIFVAVYVSLIAFLGGALAERHGYLDRFTKTTAMAGEESGLVRLVRYRAVLVAGDASIPNFDNAVDTLAHRLDRSDAETTMLTSDGSLVTHQRSYATAQVIDESLRDVPESDGCLIFVTSHGNEIGLVMGMDNAEGYYLTPWRLTEILERDCGRRPTIAILSGCHSGTFLTAPLMTENRIILTAARRDRTSFGCSTDTEFTYFDECLLEAMGYAGLWRSVFDRTKACVEQKERGQGAEPSFPQAFFGTAVQDLGIE